MSILKQNKIYYINRYDSRKTKNVKNYSGYEQIVKYHKSYQVVQENSFISNIIFRIIKKYRPKNYIKDNYSREFLFFIKALFKSVSVFYLYADKDAYILPLLKRKLKLKKLRLYGTLHWPIETSQDFSFYKNNLASEFDGIICLSSSLLTLGHKNMKVIPHGINTEYWRKDNSIQKENLYLIIGISNRDHEQQIKMINKIIMYDSDAKFYLVANNKQVRELYLNIPNLTMAQGFIEDEALKSLYNKARAVILFQNYCLASNVVLEAIAMNIPLLTNKVGDIAEYLGEDYPLYIDSIENDSKSEQLCLSESFREDVSNYLNKIKDNYNWATISKQTVQFISQ